MSILWRWWTQNQKPGWAVRQWMKANNVWVPEPTKIVFWPHWGICRRWCKEAIQGHPIGHQNWSVFEGPTVGFIKALYLPVVPWRWIGGELQRMRYVPPWWISTSIVDAYIDSRLYALRGTRWLVVAACALWRRWLLICRHCQGTLPGERPRSWPF